jgi:hypothetical protein
MDPRECGEQENAAAWRFGSHGVGCVAFYKGRDTTKVDGLPEYVEGSCFVRDKVVPLGARPSPWMFPDRSERHSIEFSLNRRDEPGLRLETYTRRHPFLADVEYSM